MCIQNVFQCTDVSGERYPDYIHMYIVIHLNLSQFKLHLTFSIINILYNFTL